MNKKTNYIIGLSCYIISFILIGYYLILELSIFRITSPLSRLLVLLIIIILTYLGSYFLNKAQYQKIKKLTTINMWLWFLLYLIMLFNLTLFDKYFGRGMTLNIRESSILNTYHDNNVNVIPFATIKNYILALQHNNLNILNFIYNIFGNIIAFMPLAFFFPRLFKSIDSWYKFLSVTSAFILSIECLQMITKSGSFDIDDYILNIIGSFIIYLIVNHKKIKIYIDNFIYLNYPKRSKKYEKSRI